MLYYFLVPLAKDHIVFNVFRYLTFRSFMALISAFIISLVVVPWSIPQLRIAQHGGEAIRGDAHERHRTHRGPPTLVGRVIAGAAFGVIAYLTGNFRAADYLKILNVRVAGELTVFCGALIGAAIGFLWFNCHPAEVFMGDAGSLALGGAIGTLAVLTKAELLLPLIGGLYVVEAVSVIIQVASFQLTGRRVFRMAPLHHHYELSGWAEPKIVVRFWIVSFALALLALTTLKLR